MEEIKLTPEELKKAIDFGKLIGSGFHGTVFTYKGRLIKLDKKLYSLLKRNSINDSMEKVMAYYHFKVPEDFNDREQLEELYKRQRYIRPKVPEGIVTLKGVNSSIDGISPGIVIHEFKDYESIRRVSANDYKKLLILFRKIFDDLRNLADNQIAQEDIVGAEAYAGPNVIQKNDDPQIIDLSGSYVKVGKNFTSPSAMYEDFAILMYDYYKRNGITERPHSLYEAMTEDKLKDIITEFKIRTRNKK